MIARLTDLSVRHRRWVLARWVAVLVAGFAAAPTRFGRLSSEAGSSDNSEVFAIDRQGGIVGHAGAFQ